MNEEQKKLAIMGGIGILLCFCLLVVCLGRKPNSDKSAYKTTTFANKTNKKIKTAGKGIARKTYSSFSSPSSTFSQENNSSAVKISKEKHEQILAFREKALKRQQEYVKENIKELLENPNTPPKVKLKVQLINNKTYSTAYIAHLNKDYLTAIEGYLALVNDKNTSPEIKYIAAEYLLDCAQLTSNLELFLKIAKIKGTLIAENNLSILGVEKSDKYLKWSEEFTDYMKARKDSAYKDKLIVAFAKKTYRTKSDAERVFNKRLAMYEDLYKELLGL